jgi:cell wall-associated NlpC family hydrolase
MPCDLSKPGFKNLRRSDFPPYPLVTIEQIVSSARTYIGTPFRHQGREKGKACDCVGLPLMVGEELGLVDTLGNPFTRYDHVNYGAQPGDDMVLRICRQRLVEMPEGHQIQPGDLLAIKNPRIACHVGIATMLQGSLGVIHALDISGIRRVVEHGLRGYHVSHIKAIFTFPGIE